MKLDQKTRSESVYIEELESLKQIRNREQDVFELQLRTVNQSELAVLKEKVSTASSFSSCTPSNRIYNLCIPP